MTTETTKILIDISVISFVLIEDNGPMRKLIRSVLSGLGARTIHEAANGEDGLAIIRNNTPDIVIVDWQMPHMHGSDVVKAIRNTPATQTLPIILITAHSDKKTIIRAMMLGVNEVLRKPFSPKALYERISAIVLEPRPFIRTKTYFGPSHRQSLEPQGMEKLPSPQVIDKRSEDEKTQREDHQQDKNQCDDAIMID